jgi:hypothetical protein
MKKRLLTYVFALTFLNAFSQTVPSYVPASGLVAYYPFNGNANDVSGTGNNGTINGATLTADRFGNANNAFSFNGNSNYILVANSASLNSANKTISVWANFAIEPTNSSAGSMSLISKWYQVTNCNNQFNDAFILTVGKLSNQTKFIGSTNLYSQSTLSTNNQLATNVWYNIVFTHDATTGGKIYVNGILVSYNDIGGNICTNQNNLIFGADSNQGNLFRFFNGKIDDIGIWNRALTQDEISNLYYTDAVCQTMLINTGVLSFNPVTYNNTVTIYPNPASTQITIDCGNLANVTGWNIKINNTLGQEVFSAPMNTQEYVVQLNTWTGTGMYFVKIYDSSGNVVNTKKIILQ